MDRLVEFILIVLLIELTPGPNMTYLAILAASQGYRLALIAVAGVALGLMVHAVLAAAGVGYLIQQSPGIYSALRWAGVACLFYIAWESWVDGSKEEKNGARPHGASALFLRGFLANVFNPKSILLFVSIVPAFARPAIDAAPSPARMFTLGALYVMIATLIHTAIVMTSGKLHGVVTAANSVKLRRLFSFALFATAIWFAWATR